MKADGKIDWMTGGVYSIMEHASDKRLFAVHRPTGDRVELKDFRLTPGQQWEIRYNEYDMRAELMLGNGLRCLLGEQYGKDQGHWKHHLAKKSQTMTDLAAEARG